MPIESHEGGITITGEAISFARLLVLRGGLRLEKQGIHVARGRRISTIVRKEFGWKERSLDRLIELIEAKIEEEARKGTPHR